MNHGPSPRREIAHFIAKILAARQTTSEDIPRLVASVRDTIEALQSGTALPVRRQFTPMAPEPPRAPRRRRRSTAAIEPVARAEAEHRVEPEPVAPIVPQLMRRADLATAPASTPFEMRAPHNGALRGVVRWFDLNTRQGALRLPGFGDEVVIDGAVLERAGISRLYKGQEVEATVVEENGTVRVAAVALPGRVDAAAHGLFKAGSARRNAKPVVVEMKRDAMRRTGARIEAEHILGAPRLESGD